MAVGEVLAGAPVEIEPGRDPPPQGLQLFGAAELAVRLVVGDGLPERPPASSGFVCLPPGGPAFYEDADHGGGSTYFAVNILGQASGVLVKLGDEASRPSRASRTSPSSLDGLRGGERVFLWDIRIRQQWRNAGGGKE